jgi:hypothetical protein
MYACKMACEDQIQRGNPQSRPEDLSRVWKQGGLSERADSSDLQFRGASQTEM